jgi:7,8-dihydroneopterin 2',3'-cyclic phosphate phosphodiesterase
LLNRNLKNLTAKIHDKKLRKKVVELLENPIVEIDGKKYVGLPLEISPAGRSHHHCYPGGYIEHVVSVTNIAVTLCKSVEKVYHGKVNQDLVIAGVLLHDVFKTILYEVNKDGSYGSTRLGDLLDHTSIGIMELVRRGFPVELVHIVASHHGEYGAVRPRTIEALVCHLADLADSRLNGSVLDAAFYLARRATGEELFRLNSNESFEIVHSKSIEGWKGVAKTVEKIKRERKAHKT